MRALLVVTGLCLLAAVGLSAGRCGPASRAPGGAGTVRSTYDGAGYPVRELAAPSRPPNLVLLVIDTLRVDVSWPSAGLMPELAALAARGVSFSDASAHAPWTKPSVASLLTGLLPSQHGAVDSRRPPALPGAVPTFAEILANAYGFETAAFVDGIWWGGPRALLQGFHRGGGAFALQGFDAAVGEWARQRRRDRPFFLLLHTLEAHEPYGQENHPWPMPPIPSAEDATARLEGLADPASLTRASYLSHLVRDAVFHGPLRNPIREIVRYTTDGWAEAPDHGLAAELRTAYGRGVAWVDGLIGNAVRRLGEWGLLENTVLVVTGDHGEAFGEHGMLGHGRQLYDEVLRVPLVMVGPGALATPRTVRASVGLADVLPTFLDLSGMALPAPIDGRSLLPLLSGGGAGHPVVAEEILSHDNMMRSLEGVRCSVRTMAWKYIVTHDRTAGTVVEELYDLAEDPEEQANLANDATRGFPRVDAETCRAIAEVRGRLWADVESDRGRVGTPYGANVATVYAGPPPSCDEVR